MKIVVLFSEMSFEEVDVLSQIIAITIVFLDCLNSKVVDQIEKNEIKGDDITTEIFGLATGALWVKYDELDHWTKLLLTLNRRWTFGPNYVPGSDKETDSFDNWINNSREYFYARSSEQLIDGIYKNQIKLVRLS